MCRITGVGAGFELAADEVVIVFHGSRSRPRRSNNSGAKRFGGIDGGFLSCKIPAVGRHPNPQHAHANAAVGGKSFGSLITGQIGYPSTNAGAPESPDVLLNSTRIDSGSSFFPGLA